MNLNSRRLEVDYMEILQNRLSNDRANMRSQDGPPKDSLWDETDSLWDETVLFKTVIGLKWIIWGSGKIALGAIGQKCVPRAFL